MSQQKRLPQTQQHRIQPLLPFSPVQDLLPERMRLYLHSDGQLQLQRPKQMPERRMQLPQSKRRMLQLQRQMQQLQLRMLWQMPLRLLPVQPRPDGSHPPCRLSLPDGRFLLFPLLLSDARPLPLPPGGPDLRFLLLLSDARPLPLPPGGPDLRFLPDGQAFRQLLPAALFLLVFCPVHRRPHLF